MEEGKHSSAHNGKNRHCLGEAVDRGAPFLVEKEKNGRNQGAGMADTDPPDEVDDGEAPGGRDSDAPDANALDKQEGYDQVQKHQKGKAHQETDYPARGRAASEHDGADLIGYRSKRMAGPN